MQFKNLIIISFFTINMQQTLMIWAVILATVSGRSVHNQATDNIIIEKVPEKQLRPLRKFVSLTKFPPPSNELSAAGGNVVELTCEAIGAPAPTVHWFKNDAPVYEHDVDSSRALESSPWSLGRVTSTQLVTRATQDQYTCVAVAGAKAARAATLVYSKEDKSSEDMTERVRLTPLAPRILVSYKVYVDVIGSTVRLICKARGHPQPDVIWTDNQDQLIQRDTHSRMKMLRSGELIISDLRWSDMGDYSCQASNANGSHQATTFVYPAKAG